MIRTRILGTAWVPPKFDNPDLEKMVRPRTRGSRSGRDPRAARLAEGCLQRSGAEAARNAGSAGIAPAALEGS